MRRIQALSIFALAFSMLAAGALYAADAATGTVTGKVVDKDGKVVSGATVAALLPPQKGDKKEKKAEDKDAKKEAAKERVLVQTTTANDGTFTLASVPVGKVVIAARKPQVGISRTTIEVKAGETTTISAPLTLDKGKKAEGEHKKKEKKEKQD